jgi:hypothetical protein
VRSHVPPPRPLGLLAAAIALAVAVTACDEANDSNPSLFVDESGAPLYDEAVDPGEQEGGDGETP